MRSMLASLAVLIVLGLPSIASADTFTFQPSPANMNDLDHHSAYTWRIDGVNLNGRTITGATLTINNIRNWDSNPNILFIHLLDTARNGGVASFIDDPTNSAPVTDLTDDFVNPRWHSNGNWLVAPGTADTFLASPSFSTTGTNFVFTFTAQQLQILSAYFLNGGNIAFGLDPDCHFFNNGITFSFTTGNAPVPEPTTIALLGTGLAGLYYRRRRQRQQQANSES